LLAAVTAFACGDDGNGVDPVPPGAPTNIQVEVRFDSIIVTWTAGSNATSHLVTLSATGEADRTATVPGGTAEAGFGVLTSGVMYTASVAAVNDDGETPAEADAMGDIAANMVMVRGEITSNTTWTQDNTYVLQGPVFAGVDGGADVTLTIEPGTTILGDPDPPGSGERGSYLVITRGSKIIADANANEADKSVPPDPNNVIVFTSALPRGERARGDWGGLVINGKAPINSGAEAEGEGNSGLFGGTDPNDDSGILRGVRVEFAGDRVTETDELNGIAFQGVGAGTTVDYVQVHYNTDDGTEPFGGTVSQTHMVMTGIGDDSFDGTDGYQGFMQFLIAQQRADDGDNGFEISNNGDNETASPHSSAVVANATMIGARLDLGSGEIAAEGEKSDHAVAFREGSNYRVFNIIATGFGKSGLCIEDGATATNASNRSGGSSDPESTLRFENNILWDNVEASVDTANFLGCDGFAPEDEEASYTATKAFSELYNNVVADPQFADEAFNIGSMDNPPNFIPVMPAGYTAFDVSTLNGGAGIVMPADGRMLVATGYAGAVDPSVALADQWYYGWTVWSTDGSDSRPNHEGN
jgi:hypothetical protein